MKKTINFKKKENQRKNLEEQGPMKIWHFSQSSIKTVAL